MDQVISKSEANLSILDIGRHARDGKCFIVPANGSVADAARTSARANLMQRLSEQTATDHGRWTRDELYQR